MGLNLFGNISSLPSILNLLLLAIEVIKNVVTNWNEDGTPEDLKKKEELRAKLQEYESSYKILTDIKDLNLEKIVSDLKQIITR